MLELSILQAAKFKGRVSPEAAMAFANSGEAETSAELQRLLDVGFISGGPNFRITREGLTRLGELIEAERITTDLEALSLCYHDFDSYNTEFKSLITDWQMIDASTPNEHTNESYDKAVIQRIADLHGRFVPLVDRIGTNAPRLASYRTRFTSAIERVKAGDKTFVARPITDSYHTVWFEFHEELINLLGLSRQKEAAAGRAG